MILKLKKPTLFFSLGLSLLLALSFLAIDKTTLSSLDDDVIQFFVSMDFGFSHPENLIELRNKEYPYPSSSTELSSNRIQKILAVLSSTPRILKYKFRDLSMERIDINVPFLEYRQIMLDREDALRMNLNVDPSFVNARLLYRGESYRAKLRLKGATEHHWRSQYRMSFRVELKGNNTILGFKKFTIQKPATRQFPYDYSFQSILQNIGNLAAIHKFARIYVNGTNWGIMNIEEHMSKEFLEKQKRKESLIVHFGNEKKKKYYQISENIFGRYLISEPSLHINLYNGKKYMEEEYYRKVFTYISKKHLTYSQDLYDIDSFIRSYLMATIWGSHRPLSNLNSRYYFNPYTLKLESIILDQTYFSVLEGNESIRYGFPKQYSQILSSPLLEKNLSRNITPIVREISNVQDHFDSASHHFPVDKSKNANPLIQNLNEFISNQKEYLNPKHFQADSLLFVKTEDQKLELPSSDQAFDFEEHIYVKHLTNGNLELYNLLPDAVDIKQILFEGMPVRNIQLTVPSYLEKPGPTIIQTRYLGEQDKNISVKSSYQGFERVARNKFSLISEDIRNPLLQDSLHCSNLCEIKGGTYLFKKGKWIVDFPMVIKGDVKIPSGTHLSFSRNAYLIIQGSLVVSGTSDEPVVLDSLSDFWKGLYVMNAESRSSLNYLEIKNLDALEDDLLRLTGGITFYKADVDIKNSTIQNVIAEDAINIIESDYSFKNVQIKNTNSDGLDSDFSDGIVEHSLFENLKGVALDLSGSKATLKKIKILGVKDEGVSAGEESQVSIEGSYLENVGIGVTSKDASKVLMTDTIVKDFTLYGVMSFAKKDFYPTPSSVLITNCELNGPSSYLRQSGTYMIVDEEEVIQESFDVNSLYHEEGSTL